MTQDTPRARLALALDEIAVAAAENIERNEAIRRRAVSLLGQLDDDVPLVELMRREPGPPIVELLSANLATLSDAGAALRGTQAQVLRAEGLTMEEIAGLFGVTRQRVSSLLAAARRRDDAQERVDRGRD